mgnify:CR=1 FL=1|tara:strand:- start:464 stop:940 length:477 start_codon:yes stop_codon:yes gene_type:complete
MFISCDEEGDGLFNGLITDSHCNDDEALYECWDGSCASSIDDCPDQLNEIAIFYTNNSFQPIANFQFTVTGVDIVSADGGDSDAAGFTVSASDSGIVIGFSSWSVMNQGGGVLLILNFFGDPSELCLRDLIFSNTIGQQLYAYQVGCNHIIIEYEEGL